MYTFECTCICVIVIISIVQLSWINLELPNGVERKKKRKKKNSKRGEKINK